MLGQHHISLGGHQEIELPRRPAGLADVVEESELPLDEDQIHRCLFLKFPLERIPQPLSVFHLAARKLTDSVHLIFRRPLQEQRHALAIADNDTDNYRPIPAAMASSTSCL